MYGEPNVYEYAKAIDDYEKRISTTYCKCKHNNCGWVGIWVTTPNGKYCVVNKNQFSKDEYYSICKYNGGGWNYPTSLIEEKFKTQEDALKYIENNRM